MITRVTAVVLIAALLLNLVSCMKTVRVFKEELPQNISEKIIEVVLISGEVVKFDEAGGKYYSTSRDAISGVTTDGKHRMIFLDRISEIRISRPQTISPAEVGGQKITEAVFINRYLLVFDENGGLYDPTQREITGKALDGTPVKVGIDKIKEIRLNRPETLPLDHLIAEKDQSVSEVVGDNFVTVFDDKGGRFERGWQGISGVTEGGKPVDLNLDDILYVRVKKTDVALSLAAVVGVIAIGVGAAFLIALALKESCPFIYSYDGKRYNFDAEPLGGAICPGLKKTDFSRLEHLQPVNGKYTLLIRNEVDETQYLDEMKLLVVDHPRNSEVMPDLRGNMYTVENTITPLSVVDENGKDLVNFVKARDEVAWQTHLPRDDSFRGRSSRHQLDISFPKPPDAKTAKLLVNAGTALWGSNMIREMLQLRGDKVDEWYEGVNRGGPELIELLQFMEREEMYLLKLFVKAGNTWVQRGFISGGGPLITEDRVIPIDLSNVAGDKLEIRLNPPIGFWSIDYLGIEYDDNPAPPMTEVPLTKAEDQQGKNITVILEAIDDSYLRLPKVGDWAKVHFNAPPLGNGSERTIFLKTTGYYEIHIAKDQPEKTQLIHQLLSTPGLILEYAMEEYLKWRMEQLNSN